MNGMGASILIVFVLIVAFAPRRWAVLGMLSGVLYLTQGQSIEVFGVNVFGVRLLEMAGIIRVLSKGELSLSNFNRIDHALLLLYSYSTMVFLLRSSEGQAFQIGYG